MEPELPKLSTEKVTLELDLRSTAAENESAGFLSFWDREDVLRRREDERCMGGGFEGTEELAS